MNSMGMFPLSSVIYGQGLDVYETSLYTYMGLVSKYDDGTDAFVCNVSIEDMQDALQCKFEDCHKVVEALCSLIRMGKIICLDDDESGPSVRPLLLPEAPFGYVVVP